MAVGNYYEVTLYQTYLSNVMINRWHYEQVTGTAGASAVLAGFQPTVMAMLAPLQSTGVVYNRLVAQNLDNVSDNSEDTTVTPANGSAPSAGMPLRMAYAFRSSRPDLSKEYAWKRFGGVETGFFNSPLFVITGTVIANLVAGMASVLSASASTWKPVQLKFVYPGGGLPPVITKNYDITSWTPIAEPSTQNSRAKGRGI